MRTALIGHTGFVGSNLLRQTRFDATYNTSNIDDIAGQEFDLLVCAGVRAEKWIANANPKEDLAGIDRLVHALAGVKAVRAILISTVDVFRSPIGPDESTPVETTGLHAYGTNRYDLERRFADRFDSVVVRLPGLYGPGIKKNVIHDFLNDHQVEKIDSRGVFQFYGLHRLWSDISIAMANRLALVHLPTEPVSVAEVALSAFDRDFTNHVLPTPATYDIRTRHATLFGGHGAYVEDKATELAGIRTFAAASRT